VFDRFSWVVAVRQLRFGIFQTLLTVGVVTASVTLIIFLSSLIGGLQKRLVSVTTDSIPSIVVTQPDASPITMKDYLRDGDRRLYLIRKTGQEQRKSKIEDWQIWLPRLRRLDDRITAVSPIVEGQTILSGPAKRQGIRVAGVIPETHNRVVEIQNKLVSGRYYGISTGDLVIGKRAADDFGLKLGDRISLLTQEGDAVSYRVAGIYKTGSNAVDRGNVFVILKDAQSLFGLGNAVTSIDIKTNKLFDSEEIASRIRLQIPYKVESWMQENQQLLSALKGQSESSRTIVFFTVMASGLGIASILITAVVSRLREIGIIRAIGATRRQILSIFMIQSVIVSSLGGVLGCVMGVGFSLLLYNARLASSPAKDEVFPPDLSWQLVVGSFALAVVVGLVAAIYPARKAARVNPIEVIRGA
jgi:lipoprotein-releasing system permease protein